MCPSPARGSPAPAPIASSCGPTATACGPRRRAHRKKATKVAPEAPLRGFLPSPDGARALGVYADEVYVDAHHKKPAEVLMGFALDGEGARRKAIKNGVPVEWSHDAQWVLVQDGASACIMHASGGEYKCWKGYTAASISPDGKFGARARQPRRQQEADARAEDQGREGEPKPKNAEPDDEPRTSGERRCDADRRRGRAADRSARRSTARGSKARVHRAAGAVVKIVDGAAVWVPSAAKP